LTLADWAWIEAIGLTRFMRILSIKEDTSYMTMLME